MADPNTAPNTAPNGATPDTAPRSDGPDRLAQLRAKLSAEQHAAQLAAQTRVEEAERNLAASQARIVELEAAASKAATVEGAQRHELALLDRRHALEMEHTQQQWKLTDARQERDRQLVEVDRARGAMLTAQHVAEVRAQCEKISQQNVALHAAIASEESRVTMNSAGVGLLVGVLSGGFGAVQSRERRKGKARGTSPAIIGAGGVLTAAVPLVAPYLKPSTPQLPAPINTAGWDAHELNLTTENTRLRAQLAALQATAFSLPTTAASAAGVGALTYAIAIAG